MIIFYISENFINKEIFYYNNKLLYGTIWLIPIKISLFALKLIDRFYQHRRGCVLYEQNYGLLQRISWIFRIGDG